MKDMASVRGVGLNAPHAPGFAGGGGALTRLTAQSAGGVVGPLSGRDIAPGPDPIWFFDVSNGLLATSARDCGCSAKRRGPQGGHSHTALVEPIKAEIQERPFAARGIGRSGLAFGK